MAVGVLDLHSVLVPLPEYELEGVAQAVLVMLGEKLTLGLPEMLFVADPHLVTLPQAVVEGDLEEVVQAVDVMEGDADTVPLLHCVTVPEGV